LSICDRPIISHHALSSLRVIIFLGEINYKLRIHRRGAEVIRDQGAVGSMNFEP
jgi:hypothetical protein